MRDIREAVRDGLNVLAVIVIVMGLMYALLGCKTERHVTERERIRLEGVKTLEGKGSIDWQTDWVRLDSVWWKRIGHVVIYDTSVTDEDGTHPVAAEIEVDEESGRESENTGNGNANANVEVKEVEAEHTGIERDTEQSEKRKDKTVSVMALFAIILLEILLLVTMMYLGKKTRQENGDNI